MADHRLRTAARFSGLAVAALMLAFPAGVAAVTNEPIAQTGGMTATLPLLGSSLTVAVTLDSAGNISNVSLDPTDTLTKTKTTPEAVKFTSADGSTKVSVKAKGDRLSIGARVTKLDDLLGNGTWSADVFGTGAKSSVDYTVGKDANGKPTVTLGTVSPADGITAQPFSRKVHRCDSGGCAAGGVSFAYGGFVKHLLVSVCVDKDGGARLKITLSGRDRMKLSGALGDLVGPRTWKGHLADGTKVTVDYQVTEEGKVVFDGATGAPATSQAKGQGLVVRFTGTDVGVQIFLKQDKAGTYTLVVRGFSGHGKGDVHRELGGKPGHGAGHGGRGHGGGR